MAFNTCRKDYRFFGKGNLASQNNWIINNILSYILLSLHHENAYANEINS